jgi:4-hydroxy-tetrahydrodipicolinate synthase
MRNKFKGLYAANIVPLNKDRSINYKELKNHIKDLINQGINNFLVNGHAGENFTLTFEEQVKILKTIKTVTKRNNLIVSGLNFESVIDGLKYSKLFQKFGADALLIFPPNSWSLSRDDQTIINQHQIIANNVKIPLFFYQSSIYSYGLNYSNKIHSKLVKIKNIIGVKEGSWNSKSYIKNYNFLKKRKKDFLVMASGDEHLYDGFKYGSDGSMVSLAILMPKQINQMIELIHKKKFKEAKKLDAQILSLAKIIYGNHPGSHATARLKFCLKLQKKISQDLTRSIIKISDYDKLMLKKSLKKLKLIS